MIHAKPITILRAIERTESHIATRGSREIAEAYSAPQGYGGSRFGHEVAIGWYLEEERMRLRGLRSLLFKVTH